MAFSYSAQSSERPALCAERGVRLDAVLVLACAALGGSWAATAPAVAIVCAGICALLVFRGLSAALFAAASLLFCLSAVRASAELSAFERAHAQVRQALAGPRRCALVLRVTRSPVWRQDRAKLVGEASEADCEGRPLPAGTRVAIYGGSADLRRGDQLYVIADLASVRVFRNLGQPDSVPRAAARGVLLSGGAHAVELVSRSTTLPGLVDQFRAYTRRRIRATFAVRAEGLARALVLGESDLSDAEDEAFRKSGLAHLLAVSGTHLVFAVVSVVALLRFCLVRIPALAARGDVGRIAALAGAVLALAYADFAGGSGSAWRAAWMLSAAFAARALSRAPDALRAVGWSIFVGVAVDPLAGFDLSFLLSLAATTGLLALSHWAGRSLQGISSSALRWLSMGVAATVASMIPCAPLLAIMAPEITVAGVAANVVAAPFGELVSLPLCLLHPLLGFAPVLERGVALAASGALVIVGQVARISADASWATIRVPIPAPGQLGLILLLAVSVLTRARRWVPVALLSLLIASEVIARRTHSPRGDLRVSVLDVGQGDATMVDLPGGELWLIDAGGFVGSKVDPGKRVILPQLRARRRKRIDVVVLSHPHPDHFGGLVSVLELAEIGEIWDTGQGERDGAGPTYARLLSLARRKKIPLLRPEQLCGRHSRSGAVITVLAPCPGVVGARPANDNSFVLHLKHGRHSALFTGDAEAELERDLIAAHGPALQADLLKVGHHGSRTSSGHEFLDVVRPSVATISCGVRNRFGHPHPRTLRALKRHGVATLRTDLGGSIIWQSDGAQLAVTSYVRHRGWLSIDGWLSPP